MIDRKAPGPFLRLAVVLSVVLAIPAPAGASALTDALAGEWSGSGRLTLPNGKTERIRCDGSAHSSTANTVDQSFRCASTSKVFDFSSSLHFSGGRVRGDWRGSGRSGIVSGSATSSSVQLRLTSDGGNGSLSASVSGCRQSLNVSGFAEEMRSLSVQLRKDGC